MSRTPPAWPRPDGGGAASAPTSRSPSGPPSRVAARPQRARVRRPSSAPPWGRSTGHRRTAASQAARATAPEARGAARSARSHCADASHPGPRARVRCSGRVTARSSAGQSSSPPRHPRSCDPALTTRSPESASSRSDPGPTGASLPDRPRSDDQQPRNPQSESIAQSPYDIFREAFEVAILPRVEAFRPDLILISAGFDAHWRDPVANLQLTEADFAWATRKLVDIADRRCGGRVVSLLEGGYDLEGLARSVAAHVKALMRG